MKEITVTETIVTTKVIKKEVVILKSVPGPVPN